MVAPGKEPLTPYQHQDPEKHFIGEALAVPGVITSIGSAPSVGTSPIPAREDHYHGLVATSYTPTFSGLAVGSGGSVIAPTANWIYDGKILTSWGVLRFGTSGQTFPNNPSFSIPSGFSLEGGLLTYGVFGDVTFTDATGINAGRGGVRYATATTLSILRLTHTAVADGAAYYNSVTTTTPFTWAQDDLITWMWSFPATRA